MRQCRQHPAGRHQLRAAQPEHRAAHHPQPLRPQLQPDQEQQHHHAEFRHLGNGAHIGHQAQAGGADGNAGKQIPQHTAEAGAAGERDSDRGGGEQGDQGFQHGLQRSKGIKEGQGSALDPPRAERPLEPIT